jgi:predicted histone-like DNA-binding protein
MAVKYILIERPNPSNRTAPKKWYAVAKSSGELTFRDLSKQIAQGSTTVSDTDVMAVLNDLIKILGRNLADGKIVRFGDFGSFQITLSSDGAEAEQSFNAKLIKAAKIQFKPGADLKDVTKTLTFEKFKK